MKLLAAIWDTIDKYDIHKLAIFLGLVLLIIVVV